MQNIKNYLKFWKYEYYYLLCALLALWFIKGIEGEKNNMYSSTFEHSLYAIIDTVCTNIFHFIGAMPLTHFVYQSVPFYWKTFVLESSLSFLLNKFQLSFFSFNPTEGYCLRDCETVRTHIADTVVIGSVVALADHFFLLKTLFDLVSYFSFLTGWFFSICFIVPSTTQTQIFRVSGTLSLIPFLCLYTFLCSMTLKLILIHM